MLDNNRRQMEVGWLSIGLMCLFVVTELECGQMVDGFFLWCEVNREMDGQLDVGGW